MSPKGGANDSNKKGSRRKIRKEDIGDLEHNFGKGHIRKALWTHNLEKKTLCPRSPEKQIQFFETKEKKISMGKMDQLGCSQLKKNRDRKDANRRNNLGE